MSDLVKDIYRTPESPLGIHLTQLAEWKVPGVLVHECGFMPRAINWNFPNVLSPFWRLYFNAQAGNYVLWKKRRINLTPRNIVLIPEECLFDCRGPSHPSHFWIHFSLTPTHVFESEAPIEIVVDSSLRSLLRELIDSCRQKRAKSDPRVLAHQSAAVLHACLARCTPRLQRPLPSKLQNILKLIQTASALEHSNLSLARQAGMSTEAFRRWFKELMGCTAVQYLRETRIRQACRELVFTDRSIEHIAEKTGFPNRHYFTRVFTRVMHQSPAAFRKKQQLF